MDVARARLLSIHSSKYYTQMEPAELFDLYKELRLYLDVQNDSSLDEMHFLSLMEMLFYVAVYLNKDIEAEVIYKTITDEFGENSPVIYVLKSILLQIKENDQKAIEYINDLIEERLKHDTDPLSYLLVSKRKLSMLLKNNSTEVVLDNCLKLIEEFPNDPELWWFVGETYLSAGKFDESIFAFEEVVLIQPFNYMAFYKISEVIFFKYKSLTMNSNKKGNAKDKNEILNKSLQNALRSIELNEFFLRGWSIVALVSHQLGTKVEILNLAHKKLNEIAELKNSSEKDKTTAKVIIEKTK
ncbi:hypothetical protein TPHA_0B01410 [Tetrapisispora phaffii CBS 4417]|uniref:ER membrane protein complex subunit 2 n=1 Tax=Tetrapisispora phaffii (strain ATCC 24235 / CBS 4417 / NBRC 1672 / NRRL Y-8282 / UCD 70-5) TaxID=1071381 RepID=G8BP83_TETPH|nr:hypothetical protein TPHA_0B01410 [Tetrapisispora phaffii CBS 4417]CCE61814.1 hypothetical protein TPHA_0B01410 [Tetrapisispora phaffii CBS 4417]